MLRFITKFAQRDSITACLLPKMLIFVAEMILDIHTHCPAPYPEGVVSVMETEFEPLPGQLYSVGIHPWDTVDGIAPDAFDELETVASLPCVAAIGECGVDLLKGAPLYRQLQIFKRQVEISEKLSKPLIIHAVKASDIILGLKRDLRPTQPWIIHGFRGKPALGAQLLQAGLMLSFGEKFNPETIASMPRDRILAETDESQLSIEEIIKNLSIAAGTDLMDIIRSNTARVLHRDIPQVQV